MPYEDFDLDISQCYYDIDGNITMSERAQKAFKNRTCGIIRENIINPRLTYRRLHAYARKYTLKINQADLDYLKGLNE